MVTEKLCNPSGYWVDLPQEKGSGTSWASSEEHLLKLATFRPWAKGLREAASEGPAVLHISFCSLSSYSK